MKTPTRFIKELSSDQRSPLKEAMKTHPSARTRMRAHAILLSERRYSVDQIADIYEVDRDSVSAWLDRWEEGGLDSLDDDPRSGRPPTLTAQEQKRALQETKKDPRSLKCALARFEQAVGKVISRDTLKRLLKGAGYVWKRMRRSLRAKRDEAAFRQSQAELAELQAQADAGELALYYYDEAGFTREPVVPYAWQLQGETLELPAGHGPRLNVLAFFNRDHDFHPFIFEGSVDSALVLACFDQFAATITQPTVVVIDQAPTHTSAEFEARLVEWEERGLYIYLLPAYAPELNLIEILWRFIKYDWLPLRAYVSFKSLTHTLDEVLRQVGSKYRINFA